MLVIPRRRATGHWQESPCDGEVFGKKKNKSLPCSRICFGLIRVSLFKFKMFFLSTNALQTVVFAPDLKLKQKKKASPPPWTLEPLDRFAFWTSVTTSPRNHFSLIETPIAAPLWHAKEKITSCKFGEERVGDSPTESNRAPTRALELVMEKSVRRKKDFLAGCCWCQRTMISSKFSCMWDTARQRGCWRPCCTKNKNRNQTKKLWEITKSQLFNWVVETSCVFHSTVSIKEFLAYWQ